jgi:hypothetical protein
VEKLGKGYKLDISIISEKQQLELIKVFPIHKNWYSNINLRLDSRLRGNDKDRMC